MPVPSIPQNLLVQQGNAQVFLSWDIIASATLGYIIYRSTNGVTYSQVGTSLVNNYLDINVTVGTLYYYQVSAQNSIGISPVSQPQSVIPTNTGDLSLGQIRYMAQQRADMVNSGFITTAEWNSYITQSYFELYDLLITTYEDYYLAAPSIFYTTNNTGSYPLPTDFYKLMGVDLGLNVSGNAWITLHRFNFIERNRYIYPSTTATYAGVYNLQYKVVGDNLMFIPVPQSNQIVRLWYIPKLSQPLQDTDILKGVSGWLEYVIVDAAIKAMQKEESDVTVLGIQKGALIKRIEDSAMNRDVGEPATISDTRNWASRNGQGTGFGPNGDGSFGGF